MIEVKKLNKKYKFKKRSIEAIKDANILLPDSGFVCILGESGSGKTTLLNILGGLESFCDGSIYYGDDTLQQYNRKIYEKYRVERFGYIFQNYLLIEDCTVEYNIDVALEMSGFSQEDRKQRIGEVLHILGMEKYRSRIVGELSGGEKQRIVVARVLAKNPKVIFADEPTANLDRKNAVLVMNLMKEMSKHCLIIMVSHQKDLVYSYADRIISIKKGHIVGDEKNIATGICDVDRDGAIYLEDFPEENYSMGNMDIHMYGNPQEFTQLNIVCIDGKLYLHVKEDGQGVLINEQSGIDLIESRAPHSEKVAQGKIQLSNNTEKSRIKAFPVVNRISNLLTYYMGKKKLLAQMVLIVNAILLSVIITAYCTMNHPDPSEIVDTNSHYVLVKFERNGIIWGQEYSDVLRKYSSQIVNIEGNEDWYINTKAPATGGELYKTADLVFYGENCSQLDTMKGVLRNFSYVPVDKLKEEQIIAGTISRSETEIVIDKWIADRIIESEDLILSSSQKYDDLIGKVVRIDGKEIITVRIVGICETNEPSIYVDLLTMYEMAEWIETADFYLKGKLMGSLKSYIDGFTGKDEKTTAIQEEKEAILHSIVERAGQILIYTEDVPKTMESIQEISKVSKGEKLNIVCSYPYEEEILKYKEQYEEYVEWIFLIGTVVLIVSAAILYYVLFADLQAQKKLLTLYYINGVGGKYLVLAYFWELMKLLALTVFPTVLLYSFLIWQFNFLQFTDLRIYFPGEAMVLITILFGIYVGVLSLALVSHFLKKPVARQGILE